MVNKVPFWDKLGNMHYLEVFPASFGGWSLEDDAEMDPNLKSVVELAEKALDDKIGSVSFLTPDGPQSVKSVRLLQSSGCKSEQSAIGLVDQVQQWPPRGSPASR